MMSSFPGACMEADRPRFRKEAGFCWALPREWLRLQRREMVWKLLVVPEDEEICELRRRTVREPLFFSFTAGVIADVKF